MKSISARLKKSNSNLFYLIFFLTGLNELVYEVIWTRNLTLVFGISTPAVSAVLTAFFLGMALGGLVIGRRTDRIRNPIRIFIFFQIIIAILGILFSLILGNINPIIANIFPEISVGPQKILLRFTISVLLLLIPTFFMGATIPLISKMFVKNIEDVTGKVGRLYSINTLGAVIGTISASFLLLKVLGIRETAWLNASINMILAITAFRFNNILSDQTKDTTLLKEVFGKIKQRRVPGVASKSPEISSPSEKLLLIAMALSSMTALGYEVIWTRILVFFVGNTTYAFAIVLSSFLLCLSLGSYIVSKLAKNCISSIGLLAIAQLIIGISVLAMLPLFSRIEELSKGLYALTNNSPWQVYIIQSVLVFLIFLIPTSLLGFSFPLIVNLSTKSIDKIGGNVGSVYFSSTIGSIFGSTSATFILIPLLGMRNGIIFLSTINIILAIYFSLNLRGRPVFQRTFSSVALLILIIAIAFPPGLDIGQSISGMRLVHYKEEISGTSAIFFSQSGNLKIFSINGIQEVPTDYSSMKTFRLLAYLPLMIHHGPKNAAILAFGGGIVAGSLSNYDKIERIDAVDLFEGVYDTAEYFKTENHNIINNPRLHLVIEDARNFISQNKSKYDIIIADATHPTSSDSWILYTSEFYNQISEKLEPEGLFVQWLPLHSITQEEGLILLRTFNESFPYVNVWLAGLDPKWGHLILVGSQSPPKIDYRLIQQVLQDNEINQDLSKFGLSNPITILQSLIMDHESISDFVGQATINVDNKPPTAFPSLMGSDTFSNSLDEMQNFFIKPTIYNIPENQKVELENARLSMLLSLEGMREFEENHEELAISKLNAALQIFPTDPEAQQLLKQISHQKAETIVQEGNEYLSKGQLDNAALSYMNAIEVAPDFTVAYSNLGSVYLNQNKIALAKQMIEKAISLEDNGTDYFNLGNIYFALQQYEEAKSAYEAAIQRDPSLFQAYTNLGSSLIKLGDLKGALIAWQKAVEINPGDEYASNNLEKLRRLISQE